MRMHFLICGVLLLALVAVCLPVLGPVWEMLAPGIMGVSLVAAWVLLPAD